MNTLESIAAGIGGALEPLTHALSSPLEAEQLLNRLGWELPPGVKDIGLSKLDIIGLLNKVTDLHASAKFDGENSAITAGISADLLITVQGFLKDINSFANDLGTIASADYLNRTHIQEELPRRILDFFLIEELRQLASPLLTFFSLTGVIRYESHPADPVNFQTAHIRHVLALDMIVPLLTDPKKQIAQLFDWGTPQFDPGKLLTFFGFFLNALGGGGSFKPLARKLEERLSGRSVPEAETLPMPQLVISLKRGFGFDELNVGVSLLGLRPTGPDKADGGFAFSPFVRGTPSLAFPMKEGLSLAFESSFDITTGCVVSIRPGHPGQIQTQVNGNGAVSNHSNGRVVLSMKHQRPDSLPMMLLTLPGGSGLDMREFTTTFGVDTGSAGISPMIEFGLNGLHFHIGNAGSDGFLAKILPSNLDADFDLTIGWSGEGGVYIRGSSTLELHLPLHINLSPISIEGLTVEVKFADGKIFSSLGADIRGSLGPLEAIVQNIGMAATFSFPANNAGNLGPVQLDLGFKPPNGVGLTLDVGIIKGGGFLLIDVDKGEYVGAMELDFIGVISLKAIGIINTIMPDGSKGFSMLIIITAEFPPIQLGFGFTLNAVGGILGLNRTVKIDILREGVKTNAIKSILFPQDIIANITRIVSDIKQVFPPYPDHFVVGPMAELGWGTPSILTLEIGILLEIPVPRIAILGVIKALIPSEDLALLRIQVNFLGVIDFQNKYISFDASLFDSRLLIYTLAGDMAFRLSWGDNPMFILSVGGFHPAFHDAPADLQHMTRLTISLLSGDNPRISVQSYFAVTSNTVQFGARAELYAAAAGFNVYGFIGYDVLFQFDPFKFIADFSAALALRRGDSIVMGISVSGHLAGPTPFNAKGDANIDFFFFSVSVSFNETWGDNDSNAQPEKIDLIPLLTDALKDDRNWKAVMPDYNNLHVSVKKPDLPPDKIVIHPFGVLTFSERLVPLDVTITKFGNKVPDGANLFTIKESDPGIRTTVTKELFSPANFFDKSDNEKLSSPSFESMNSGFQLTGAADLNMPIGVLRNVDYELSYLHKTQSKLIFAGVYKYAKALFKSALKGSAASSSTLSFTKNKISANAPDKVIVQPGQYAIANVSDMKLYQPDMVSGSYTEAKQHYDTLIKTHPEMKDQVQILSHFEINMN